jgi:hypothetical protein
MVARMPKLAGSHQCALFREILERINNAIADTSGELRAYIKDHPDFEDIGNRMLKEWEQGIALSLKAT